MATEQQGSQPEARRHDGGAVSEAPESGAMGTRQNESATSTESGASVSGGAAGQRGHGTQAMQGQGRGAGQTEARGNSRAGQSGPLSLMRRISEDMDRLFEGFFGPSSLSSSGLFGGASGLRGSDSFGLGRGGKWPEIEVHQEGNRFVIQADVPGLNREDVHVEVRERQIWISGERRTQSERQEGGFYHTERSYGSFSRAIPLPENANLDSASASFENGVLRIEIESPETRQDRGRRIEIREGKPQ